MTRPPRPLRSTLEARSRVIGALTAALVDLDTDDAEAALWAAGVHTNRPLRELDAFLAAHPGAITERVADFPLAWTRLAHALRAAGHPVPAPACARCGVVTAKLRPSPAGRVCPRCAPTTSGPSSPGPPTAG